VFNIGRRQVKTIDPDAPPSETTAVLGVDCLTAMISLTT
jgi:hypothetical protein